MNHQSLTERNDSCSQPLSPPRPTATDVARDVLARLEAAWNAADGAAFGAVYAPDASFVTIRGEHIVGSDRHRRRARRDLRHDLRRQRQPDGAGPRRGGRPRHVLAISVNTLDCPTGPLAGIHQAAVDERRWSGRADGSWRASLTHNTLVVA